MNVHEALRERYTKRIEDADAVQDTMKTTDSDGISR